jgi:hypothetical protein
MMPPPIIFLASANDTTAHLALLKEEIDTIDRSLRQLDRHGFIRVKRDEHITARDLIDHLATFQDQIVIFHFAGHAGAKLLSLDDQPVQAEGLADFFQGQNSLKLVFLNGCSTREQVQLLFDAGVPAVIATSVEVNDGNALLFAEVFYDSLAKKYTIERAFHFAQAAVKLTAQGAPSAEIYRGVKTGEKDETFPWGLYINEGQDEVLNWRLPHYHQQGLPQKVLRVIDDKYEVNRDILRVLDEMCRYNPDIYHQMVDKREGKELLKDSSQFPIIIIKNFPWVIGAQIRLLLIENKLDRERLRQLISTYIIASKVIYFIMLANVWAEVYRDPRTKLGEPLSAHLLTRDNAIRFDFTSKGEELFQKLQELTGELFVPELEEFYEKLKGKTTLSQVRDYFNELKGRLDELPEETVKQECRRAEKAVAVFLEHIAFLANYRMLTVREISIENPLYSEEYYDINHGMLHANDPASLRLYEDLEYRRKEAYSNCRSVVLVHDDGDFNTFLNLSPFIIDKNTFLHNPAIDVFMYGFEEQGHYYYLAINHNIFDAFDNVTGADIIHTGMTDKRFEEGKNLEAPKKAAPVPSYDFLEKEVETGEGVLIFAGLERLFEHLKTDLF